MLSDSLLELADAIGGYIAKANVPSGAIDEAKGHLLQLTECAQCQPFTGATKDYGSLVQAAVENARHAPVADVADHLLPVHDSLPWVYHYEPRSVEEDLGGRVAFAELIGPDGPMRGSRGRVGFTVMAPQTLYPMHSHPAVELYLVLTGIAKWWTPTSNRRVLPGEFVLHRSNEPHAMQTFDEPLLALWSWSGDVDTPAVYL